VLSHLVPIHSQWLIQSTKATFYPSFKIMNAPSLSVRAKQLLDLEGQYTAGGYDPVPAFISRARGVKLWVRLRCSLQPDDLPSNLRSINEAKDIDGQEYLDFTCMFNAVNQGHSHPVIIEAVVKQMQNGTCPLLSSLNLLRLVWQLCYLTKHF
jgi:acetylornithine/succinyldiaminopimelate/putrescine aminotransferase